MKTKKSTLYSLAATVLYYGCSIVIFNKVYEASDNVIDELFHVPQGIAYCKHDFSYWNNKITTLPGLYIVSSIIGFFNDLCTTYNLRLVNFIASGINVLLMSTILRNIYGHDFKIILLALNLALLPPLYFFTHLYYTETLSLLFVLACSLCTVFKQNNFLTLVFGICSIVMRQTNIIWIGLVFGQVILNYLLKISVIQRGLRPKRYYNLSDLISSLLYHLKTGFVSFFKFLRFDDWTFIITHLLLVGSFIGFVVWNGSIVVGDKEAHVATLHIPQMFYFLLFYGVFSLPHVLSTTISTIKLMFNNKLKVIFYMLMFLIIVHYNTIVHPYLLADNRHYTFYVWNRWFGKYDFAVYASVPIYVFLLFNVYDNVKDNNSITFLFPYTLFTFVVLSLQKMIELRYFLIPYIILRMRLSAPSTKLVVIEFLWYLFLNFVTFYIFFSKQFMWKDFDYPQRIIW